MTRPRLEVADVFRRFGPAWRAANAGHLSPAQRRAMRAVELCRTAELGGHVEQCQACAHVRIAYNSCRNRHCPKCQWATAQAWLAAREAELLPVPHFHLVFTLPAAHGKGEIELFGALAGLAEPGAFRAHLAAQRRREWVVYAKAPFAGPQQVLAYLARCTHRTAISNRRLVALDGDGGVSFRWKDHRDGRGRPKPKVMRLAADEFMRRFLLHVLPAGFHRVRHSGLFANGHRAAMLARCRELLDVPPASAEGGGENQQDRHRAAEDMPACPCCGGPMRVIERFEGPCSRRRYPARKPDGR